MSTDIRWYEDQNNISILANYLAATLPATRAGLEELARAVEKPWHFEDAFAEAQKYNSDEPEQPSPDDENYIKDEHRDCAA